MVEWRKLSEAIGSATPDPRKNEAAAQPIPPPAVGNKPAPGQRGPRGLSPRTTYTRVNTGAPPVPDAGASGQKSMSPRGMEFLPTKVAHKEKVSMTTMMQRPNLQELVKEAMEGTVSKVDISAEAARQLANVGVDLPEQSKTASAASPDTIPTEYVHKLADALEFMAKQAEEGTTSIKPGSGPNALKVEEATSSETNVDAGEQGQAKATVPMTPPMQNSGVAKDAPTAMESNDDMQHAEQPVDPMGNEKSAALLESNLAVFGLTKEALDKAKMLEGVTSAGRKAKQVLTGSKARSLARDLKKHDGALPSAMSDPMKKQLKKEVAKTVGAYGGIAGGTALGAKALKGKSKDKEKKAEEDPKKLTTGEKVLAVVGGGPGGYFGAKKAREAGESALAGGVRGYAGGALGSVGGNIAGAGLGHALARAAGASRGGVALGQSLGGLAGGIGGAVGGYKLLTKKYNKPEGEAKQASILARNFMVMGLKKQAEDALSPAQISAGGTQTGATPPEGASASGEQVPSEPSDVNKQKNLVSTNESAINYTKREAKADPKSDAGKVLDEPALSASTDKTLQKTLDHTQQAGAKIASDMMKAAAAQAILSKLAEEASAEADEKKKKAKEKQSQGMSGLSDPSGQSGFTATSV